MEPSIHQAEREERRGRHVVAAATLAVVALLASSWVGLFSFLGASASFGTFSDLERRYLPDTGAVDLSLPDLSRLSRVYTSEGVVLAELHAGRNSEPVRLDRVPEQLRNAILAAEDADFYTHQGIDFQAIMRAAINNMQGGRRQGGSTITQQVVKQYFVGSELTIERKIAEAVMAAELERRYTKDQILQFYVNSVYFGSGAYGVRAAAREFFHKQLDDLDLHESATLAMLIRNPAFYDPRRQPERAEGRRNDILGSMARLGFVTQGQADRAMRQPLAIERHREFQGQAPHVVAEVKRQLLHDPEFAFLGANYEERKKAVFGCDAADIACHGGGGLKIHVTLDLGLQQRANEILESWLPVPEEQNTAPTGALASVDNETGAVLVMASGLPFDEEQFDLATQGRRNPGSAFKPFTLVAALESGISLRSYWDSSNPQRIDCGFPCAPNGSSTWTVRNATGVGHGLLSLFEATAGSVNTVFAQVSVDVGPANIVEVAHRMGIQSDLPEVYSLTLGTGAVTPLEMASAFSNFATNGVYAAPYLIQRIENAAGDTIYEHDPSTTQAIDPGLATAARSALEQVVCCGTGTAAQLGRPQLGKTGTHQSYYDAWFIGGVPQITTAVWVGFPDDQTPLENVTINDTFYSRVFGGSVPAPIWKEFMEIALAGTEVLDFPSADDDRYFAAARTEVPSVVGLSEGEAKARVLDAHLRAVVEEVDSLEPVGTVVQQSPAGGATATQGSSVVLGVSTGEPPAATLPDLRGMTLAEADAALRQLAEDTDVEVSYSVVYRETDDPSLIDRVIRTQPGAGSTVTTGDQITLVMGKEKKGKKDD